MNIKGLLDQVFFKQPKKCDRRKSDFVGNVVFIKKVTKNLVWPIAKNIL